MKNMIKNIYILMAFASVFLSPTLLSAEQNVKSKLFSSCDHQEDIYRTVIENNNGEIQPIFSWKPNILLSYGVDPVTICENTSKKINAYFASETDSIQNFNLIYYQVNREKHFVCFSPSHSPCHYVLFALPFRPSKSRKETKSFLNSILDENANSEWDDRRDNAILGARIELSFGVDE